LALAKILVVDDEEDVVKALTLRLKSAGYEVLTAGDGLNATQMAVKHNPELIILDIGMPGGDGHTVAERLKTNMKTLAMPIIYLTARANQTDMKKATELGAAGYLLKPFKGERLLALVERVLEESRQGRSLD
jgi:DNA-binding response OmpR family regulator